MVTLHRPASGVPSEPARNSIVRLVSATGYHHNLTRPGCRSFLDEALALNCSQPHESALTALASVWHRGRPTSRVALQDHRPSLRIQGLGDVRAGWARSWAASMLAVWSRWWSRNPEALKRPAAPQAAGRSNWTVMSDSIVRLVSATGHHQIHRQP